ncbi:type II toxin-antitoxin system PemK/MazF family toxin [Lactobacillus sp. PV034]|uniref:type II toxin-antitoxin system PemK/MazF family toxin n=1 Tax=Lactobacillus sp. PV034 TaxID=2594495 RepID=UPI0022402E32|nr:type II toxin-antitoxin system PemK/MazF family toxin [Lactobacillus sp. PV034]QNQ80193.1 type II toxin-antitoxin system PemK/MazF family toxin [Lactobacillus sp. PV034]
MFKQGEIYYFNLEPSRGVEEKKTRPCVIVSNDNYNRIFNTVMVLPISSSSKYLNEEKYQVSPLFKSIVGNKIRGTILLQHLRTIDPSVSVSGPLQETLSLEMIESLQQSLKHFF